MESLDGMCGRSESKLTVAFKTLPLIIEIQSQRSRVIYDFFKKLNRQFGLLLTLTLEQFLFVRNDESKSRNTL
jgi:phage protein D